MVLQFITRIKQEIFFSVLHKTMRRTPVLSALQISLVPWLALPLTSGIAAESVVLLPPRYGAIETGLPLDAYTEEDTHHSQTNPLIRSVLRPQNK